MSFADWVKRSDLAATALSRDKRILTVLQAAFKAGERDGRKQVEAITAGAIGLAITEEREECAKVCDEIRLAYDKYQTGLDFTQCADAIRKRGEK